MDIDFLMSALARNYPIFKVGGYRDPLFQVVKSIKPSAQIDVGYSGPETGFTKFDLLIRDGEENTVIKFRYKTALLEVQHNSEIYSLKQHSALPQGRYDFLRDIAHIEEFCRLSPGNRGCAVILTNDASYWKVPNADVSDHVDNGFQISESIELLGNLKWHPKASAGTMKSEQPIQLEGRYKCYWKDYSTFAGKNGQFRYLGFAIDGDAAGINAYEGSSDGFDPADVRDGRERIWRSIAERRGQQAFRDKLRKAYGDRCAISGCKVVDVLEAAHIYPYRGKETNLVTNGLLLRADLHTLFDCLKISVDSETMKIWVSPDLRKSEYGDLHGRLLRLPTLLADQPSKLAISDHFAGCTS